jgi:hypothetical protein
MCSGRLQVHIFSHVCRFQEWVLTSGCLIFLESLVVFCCRYAKFPEDIISDVPAPTGKLLRKQPKLHKLNDFDFSCLCLEYELRTYRRFLLQRDLRADFGDILTMTIGKFIEQKLTYDTDLLNAFQGILLDFARFAKSETVMGTIIR